MKITHLAGLRVTEESGNRRRASAKLRRGWRTRTIRADQLRIDQVDHAIRCLEGSEVRADLLMRECCHGGVRNRPEAAPVECCELRYDRERRAALPDEDRAGLPSVNQQSKRTAGRVEQPVAFPDWQFIGEVCLERMRQVERCARTL